MPLDPKTIEVLPPVERSRSLLTNCQPHVIAIDAMLRRPWHEHEFEEDEKGDRPAGRTYDVSKLALQDWRYLEDIYTRAGWKVGRCGGSNESYITPAADQRRFLVFCPADRVRQRL